jgi:hypothetical protein
LVGEREYTISKTSNIKPTMATIIIILVRLIWQVED